MNTACPETPELLDHIEGKTDLSDHVVSCELCSQALGDLRHALDAESALVATAPLDVERALGAVKERARRAQSARWQTSIFFTAAAAVALALLLPPKLAPVAGAGPEGGSGSPAQAGGKIPMDVTVQNPVRYDPLVKKILDADAAVATTAVIHS